MKMIFSCLICVLVLSVLCSCSSKKVSSPETKKLSYLQTAPIILKNDSNEQKVVAKARSLKDAKEHALKLGVVPFEKRTFPQVENSIKKGTPVIIESNKELVLVIGHDPDKRIFLQKKADKLVPIQYERLLKLYIAAGRKAVALSEPWEINQDSDLYEAFVSGLKISETKTKKAQMLFKRLVDLAPEAPGPYLALANTYPTHESSKAVKVLEEGVARNPNEFALWYNLAAFQLRSGQKWQSRLTAWKTQTMFRPEDVPSRLRGRLSLLGSN